MSAPVKIVYLLDSLKRGGVQQGALLQIPLLDPARFRAEAWTLRCGEADMELAPAFEERGIPVRRTPLRSHHDRAGIVALASLLQREGVGLLNTKSFFPNLAGRLAGVLAGGPAIVANYHHTYEHKWAPRFIVLERLLRERTDAFLCVSERVREVVAPLAQLPPDRCRVVYNGIDLAAYAPAAPRDTLRRELGLATDRPIVASIGRLTRVKDLPVFLDALVLLRGRIPDLLGLVAGDGEERPRLEAYAREKGLGESVRFLGSRGDVPRLLACADCLAIASLLEGFPRILLEAFAARTPVVSTPAGGTMELLREGVNGLSVPFSDPAALADGIERTLRSPGETQKRVERAFSDVQSYSLAGWVRATEALFEAALARRRDRAGVRAGGDSLTGLRWKYEKYRFCFEIRRALYTMSRACPRG